MSGIPPFPIPGTFVAREKRFSSGIALCAHLLPREDFHTLPPKVRALFDAWITSDEPAPPRPKAPRVVEVRTYGLEHLPQAQERYQTLTSKTLSTGAR